MATETINSDGAKLEKTSITSASEPTADQLHFMKKNSGWVTPSAVSIST
jgi:hypothetical protein